MMQTSQEPTLARRFLDAVSPTLEVVYLGLIFCGGVVLLTNLYRFPDESERVLLLPGIVWMIAGSMTRLAEIVLRWGFRFS